MVWVEEQAEVPPRRRSQLGRQGAVAAEQQAEVPRHRRS